MNKKFNEFDNEQMDFIKENYAELVDEVIRERIDNDLMYYTDIEDAVFSFTNIIELLNGNYTMEDLYEDMFDSYYDENFADIAEDIYNEYLTEELKEEIDNLI